jgi:hypothetical protein
MMGRYSVPRDTRRLGDILKTGMVQSALHHGGAWTPDKIDPVLTDLDNYFPSDFHRYIQGREHQAAELICGRLDRAYRNKSELPFRWTDDRLTVVQNRFEKIEFPYYLGREADIVAGRVIVPGVYVYSFPQHFRGKDLEFDSFTLKIGGSNVDALQRAKDQIRDTNVAPGHDGMIFRVYEAGSFKEGLEEEGAVQRALSEFHLGKEWYCVSLATIDAVAKARGLHTVVSTTPVDALT